MGFIQSNHSRILYNNTMISFNMVEAARQHKVKRFLYTSSACIYPEHKQLETDMQVKSVIKCVKNQLARVQALIPIPVL
jgi:nucleoside-diphosphate-sugar epimerase